MAIQEKTTLEIEKECALSDLISFKCTSEEKNNLYAVSKQNAISVSELLRNLMRKHLHEFAVTENMSKYLRISGEIDMILVEKAVISSRKASNLSKMFEILSGFEVNLKSQGKNFDYDDHKSWRMLIDKAMLLIYRTDSFLFEQLEPTWNRITKMKQYKALDSNL